MKLKTFLFLSLVTFLFGCSKDNEPETQTGGIEVIVLIKNDNEPIFDVIVSISSISKEELTDIEGTVFFRNIEVGSYEISITDPFRNIPIKQIVDVENNKTTKVVIFVDGPNVVTPSVLDIDKWVDASFSSLVANNIFGANGYASIWGEIGSDILTASTSNSLLRKLDNYEFSPNDKIIEDIWANHYKVIRNANIGIEAIENSDFISELNSNVNEVEAQFKFLRSLVYFNLVKLFGNPVLVTSTDISQLNNPAIQDRLKVYELIEEDLIFAENNLEDSNIKGKASKSAAQALLGKVYLQMAGFPLLQNDKYAKALNLFAKLDGKYTLETDYKNNFEIEKGSTNNEIIFTIDFNIFGDSNNWKWFNWGPLDVSEKDFYLLTTNFIESYFKSLNDLASPITFPLSTKDSRFFENIAPFKIQNGVTSNAQNIDDWRPYKFSENYQNGGMFHLPYLRYSDVLLMIAEAENAINGPTVKAYEAINLVRRRAFGNTDNDLSAGLDQEEFLDAILNERRLELCYEGHRKDDLIRTQKLQSVIDAYNINHPQNTKKYQSHKYIFPIPQSEILLNSGIIQNLDY
ncbi:RagB/SusD family nutrient uptake outer membrane protein [uncultured Algibacter sp.]|uniref:RagB/SusD family nutrient uptake outer membrane protein n=1 Tax=uncultured Algibacter sp. TaxID=298659 RepID=UPI00262F4241|nr:RagB/SusD family nutrient uptake outer membrane protein [uncultured Algibacter sp.]